MPDTSEKIMSENEDPETLLIDKNEFLKIKRRDDYNNTETAWHDYNVRVIDAIGTLKAKCHERADQIGMMQIKIDAVKEHLTRFGPGNGFGSFSEWMQKLELLLQ
jgi:hypothetical protein